jgi:predicted class III extradiol MEMO1 family dioxygenase
MSSGLFEIMNINTDEDEHSIEMQLPYIAKVMEGLVLLNNFVQGNRK